MFVVTLTCEPAAATGVAEFIARAVGQFTRGIELGFFGPGQPFASLDVRSGGEVVEAEVRTAAIPPAHFRVLAGMIERGRVLRKLTFGSVRISQDGAGITLDGRPLPASQRVVSSPQFNLVRPQYLGFGESAVILVRRASSWSEEDVQWIESGFDVWESLVDGGFPPPDGRLGESGVGAAEGFLISPVTYQWSTEGLAIGSAGLDSLIRFFEEHAVARGIVAVDVEA